MNLNNTLIFPVNKIPNYSKKGFLKKNPSTIINLILPNHPSSFRLNERIIPKIILFKKGNNSMKKINLNNKIPSIKDSQENISPNSQNKNLFESFDNKKAANKGGGGAKSKHVKSESFSKINKNQNSSRNKSYTGNLEKLIHVNKRINNSNSNNVESKKFCKKKKITKSFLTKNKSSVIPKGETKINKKSNNYSTYGNIPTTTSDKENINMNLTSFNETNPKENLIFSMTKKDSKKKINLPISSNSNRPQNLRKINYKKCSIKNYQSYKSEAYIPYNKDNKLSSQSWYYNLNKKDNKNQRKKIINITSRDEGGSFVDTFNKKNFSMCSFDMMNKTNGHSYANTEILDINDKKKFIEEEFGVEMYHFRIVQIVQENKSMLKKLDNI